MILETFPNYQDLLSFLLVPLTSLSPTPVSWEYLASAWTSRHLLRAYMVAHQGGLSHILSDHQASSSKGLTLPKASILLTLS